VSLLFTSAKLKDGKEIPVKATVLAAFPEGDPLGAAADVANLPAPEKVDGDGAFNQQPGAISHVALTSAVKSPDSGTFSSTEGNFKLYAGTFLQVGIAPAGAAGAPTAAE
jgi:hypothetical protein